MNYEKLMYEAAQNNDLSEVKRIKRAKELAEIKVYSDSHQ